MSQSCCRAYVQLLEAASLGRVAPSRHTPLGNSVPRSAVNAGCKAAHSYLSIQHNSGSLLLLTKPASVGKAQGEKPSRQRALACHLCSLHRLAGTIRAAELCSTGRCILADRVRVLQGAMSPYQHNSAIHIICHRTYSQASSSLTIGACTSVMQNQRSRKHAIR